MDAVAVDDQGLSVDLDRPGEASVDAVIFQQMRVGLHIGQIVDGNEVKIVAAGFEIGSQNQPADPPKSVDCYTCGHFILIPSLSETRCDRIRNASAVILKCLYNSGSRAAVAKTLHADKNSVLADDRIPAEANRRLDPDLQQITCRRCTSAR